MEMGTICTRTITFSMKVNIIMELKTEKENWNSRMAGLFKEPLRIINWLALQKLFTLTVLLMSDLWNLGKKAVKEHLYLLINPLKDNGKIIKKMEKESIKTWI
jgi:hypothetical protein